MSDLDVSLPPDGDEPREPGPGNRKVRNIAMAIVPIVAVAGLLGFGLTRDPRALPDVLAGRPAPSFALQDFRTGRVVRLSSLRGHPVVMNFWAPTCVDCVVEHPFLLSAWRRYAPRGVVFLSVLHQDPEGLARQFDRERRKPWPDLADPGSRTALDYGVSGIPETVFIRPDGVVAHRIIGASSPSEVKAWIERIFGRGAATS